MRAGARLSKHRGAMLSKHSRRQRSRQGCFVKSADYHFQHVVVCARSWTVDLALRIESAGHGGWARCVDCLHLAVRPLMLDALCARSQASAGFVPRSRRQCLGRAWAKPLQQHDRNLCLGRWCLFLDDLEGGVALSGSTDLTGGHPPHIGVVAMLFVSCLVILPLSCLLDVSR